MRANPKVQMNSQSETESIQSLKETDNVSIFQSDLNLPEVDLKPVDPGSINIKDFLVPEENYSTLQSTALADVSAKQSGVKNKETEQKNATLGISTDIVSSTSKEPNYLQPLDASQNNLVANNVMPRSSLVPQVNSSVKKNFYQTVFWSRINPSVSESPKSETLEKKRSASEFPNHGKKVKIPKRSYTKQTNPYGLSIPHFTTAEKTCINENANWYTLPLEERRKLIQIEAKQIKKAIDDEHKERVKTASSFKKT